VKLAERVGNYLLTVPERLVRSAAGISGGLLRELSDVAVPIAVRRTRLYQNLVESTLRFVIEQVGEVEGAYPESEKLAENFAIRRAAGNGIEMVGLIAFRASPVWVMAALADLSGAGRHLVREIAAELKANQLLPHDSEFTTMDELLAGLETFSERTANTINTPPLDIAGLRQEWRELRANAAALPTPAIESLESLWRDLRNEAQRQGRSTFALSSMMALSAVTSLPERLVWLSKSAPLAARRTRTLLGEALLGHYRITLDEIHRTGYLRYWIREFKPYLRAAAEQFSPRRRTLTQRFLDRTKSRAL
jgi:hypothetical protein